MSQVTIDLTWRPTSQLAGFWRDCAVPDQQDRLVFWWKDRMWEGRPIFADEGGTDDARTWTFTIGDHVVTCKDVEIWSSYRVDNIYLMHNDEWHQDMYERFQQAWRDILAAEKEEYLNSVRSEISEVENLEEEDIVGWAIQPEIRYEDEGGESVL